VTSQLEIKRVRITRRLSIGALLTILFGITSIYPAKAAGEVITIKSFVVTQTSASNGPIVQLTGLFKASVAPGEVTLDLATYGPIGTRSELTALLRNPHTNQGMIHKDISVVLKSPAASQDVAWSLKFNGNKTLGLAQPGTYLFGVVDRASSAQTNVVAPWFYANKNLKPTKVVLLPQVSVENLHLADGTPTSLNSDAVTLARLNNLTDASVPNVTWVKDASVDTWLSDLTNTALKPAAQQVKARVDSIDAKSRPGVYGHADLQALVVSSPNAADLAFNLSTSAVSKAVLYIPKTGAINAQSLAQLAVMHQITPVVSNKFTSGNALQTTSAIAKIHGVSGVIYDAGISNCFLLSNSFRVNECLVAQIAMITAESPNQARTIAVVTPALWSPGSGQLSKIANQITDSGVGEFTSLAAAQQASAHLDNYFADAPSGVISAALLSQEKSIAKKAQVLGTAFNSQDFIDAYAKAQVRNHTDVYSLRSTAYRLNKKNLVALEAIQEQIAIGSSQRISIASPNTDIPLTIINHSKFPLKVRAVLASSSSSRLTAVPTDLVTVQVGQRVTVPIKIHFAGIGKVDVTVSLENSAGQSLGLSQKIAISSAGYQSLARTLVWGACGMLVLFAIVNAARKRRGEDSSEPSNTSQ